MSISAGKSISTETLPDVAHVPCRYTGSNLGHYMNAAMHLAVQATQEELDAHEYRHISLSHTVPRTTPTDFEGLPDFLTVGAIYKDEKWRETGQNMDFYRDMYSSWTMLFMGSRKLFRALQAHSKLNRGTDLEGFIPTVAVHARLKVAAIPMLPHDKHGEYIMHCCSEAAPEVYGAWFSESESCLPGYLMHPIKGDVTVSASRVVDS